MCAASASRDTDKEHGEKRKKEIGVILKIAKCVRSFERRKTCDGGQAALILRGGRAGGLSFDPLWKWLAIGAALMSRRDKTYVPCRDKEQELDSCGLDTGSPSHTSLNNPNCGKDMERELLAAMSLGGLIDGSPACVSPHVRCKLM